MGRSSSRVNRILCIDITCICTCQFIACIYEKVFSKETFSLQTKQFFSEQSFNEIYRKMNLSLENVHWNSTRMPPELSPK